MKVTFKQSDKIKVFDAITTMVVFENAREDLLTIMQVIYEHGVDYQVIQEMLRVPAAETIAKGIVNYLKQNGLIDEHHTITSAGHWFLQSKQYPALERGKFKFWMIDHPLLGRQLLHYQRENSKERTMKLTPFIHATELEGKTFHSVLNMDEKRQFQINKFDYNRGAEVYCVDFPNINTEYKIHWEIDTEREEPSTIIINGEIKDRPQAVKRFSQISMNSDLEIDYTNFLVELISKNRKDVNWNFSTKAFEIKFKEIDNIEELKAFTTILAILDVETDYGLFEDTAIREVPIMPASSDDAKLWVDAIIKDSVATQYVSQVELQHHLQTLKERRELVPYQSSLYHLDESTFLQTFRTEKDKAPYWHLQAPLDLKPYEDKANIIETKHIAFGNRYSMREVVRMIVGDERPERLIFSSKHVQNFYQIKKFNLFTEAFKSFGVQDIQFVTTEYVDLPDKSIRIDMYEDVYGDRKEWPHDRYFAFETNRKWHFFKMTAELDQCVFDRTISANNLTINTVGYWKDISFIQILPEIFPLKLREFTQEQMITK
ncbi:hypothetical protein JOC95_001924 [Bacillus tianshenii]|uniref:Uncharacterized protein n=1 Tax=Sutcliffiella tianshenii TaxID=1463404 RepID=A0ABS2P0A0_9BACI|nr:hypothetical protein [Bacillus tianshenii]MBM7620072.1 hypothetical protein [Bacillus tianshenii]